MEIGVDEIFGVNYLWNTGLTSNKITTSGFLVPISIKPCLPVDALKTWKFSFSSAAETKRRICCSSSMCTWEIPASCEWAYSSDFRESFCCFRTSTIWRYLASCLLVSSLYLANYLFRISSSCLNSVICKRILASVYWLKASCEFLSS